MTRALKRTIMHQSLPYFDRLLQRLEAGDPDLLGCFGRHVHWGYWEQPRINLPQACSSFAAAAEALSHQLLNTAQIADGQHVLDVGCGFGGTIACLNEGWHNLALTGVNLDARQIARAQANIQAQAGNTITWLTADACALPLADASQDVVLAVECIFHFPSRDRFLAEVQRVLKPGGWLVLSDFVPVAPLAWLLRQRASRGAGPLSSRTYGPIDCTWGWRRYASRAARHGLQLMESSDITRHTLPTYGVVCQLFTAMGWPSAATDTALIERLSRWGWLRYRILGFQRD